MGKLLEGKVAVITGAGNGLGRAHALGMAAQGAKVVVNDVGTSAFGEGNSSNPADLVAETIKKNGGQAAAVYDSVATEASAKNIIKTAIDKFGRIDILVNNAGIIRGSSIQKIASADWDAMLKVHLYGTFYCTHAAVNYMVEQKYGRIINTSSHNGLGMKNGVAYSSAKEGITGFTRAVARDVVEYGITCNVIRPIAAWRGAPIKVKEFEENKPEDVAVLVVYLATEAASNINGCIFEVWNGHIGMYEDPPPIKGVIYKDGSFTPEDLVKLMPQTLSKDRTADMLPEVLPFKLSIPGKK